MSNKKKPNPLKKASRMLEAYGEVMEADSRKELETVLSAVRVGYGEAKRLKAEAAAMRKEADYEASILGRLIKKVKKELEMKKKAAKAAAKETAKAGAQGRLAPNPSPSSTT